MTMTAPEKPVITKTQTLLNARATHVPRGVSALTPLFAAKAEGAKLWDVEGKEFIDFAGGIGVLNVGHSHAKVQAAVKMQLEAFTHTCFQVVAYESYVLLAEKLNALVPQKAQTSICFAGFHTASAPQLGQWITGIGQPQ